MSENWGIDNLVPILPPKAWNSEAFRYFVETPYHPNREIDIDTLLLLAGPSNLGKVQIFRDVLAAIESSVQFLRSHKF